METSVSFRALSKSFSIDTFYSDVKNKTPSHSTIINWIHKIGYYQLTKAKEFAEDWIIILDHSIQLGQDKVFVILGIRESEIDFSRPLQYHDLVPLRIESRKKWNGKTIAPYLEKLQKEIGVIKYAVGDYGSDIKKGLELMNIRHVHDITHVIALILEHIYSKDEEYLELTKSMSLMRSKFRQTNIAYIIPPNQRSKSRYHNTKIISDWGNKALGLLDNLSAFPEDEANRIQQELSWIKKYKTFINDLSEINQVICNIEKIVKSKGICDNSINESKKILSTVSSKKSKILEQKLLKYFYDTQKLLKTKRNILCTSDILESAFGKYKNYTSNNPMAGITNLVLSIAAFTILPEKDVVKEALENTVANDIKKWTKDFIGTTLLQKRKTAFSFK